MHTLLVFEKNMALSWWYASVVAISQSAEVQRYIRAAAFHTIWTTQQSGEATAQ